MAKFQLPTEIKDVFALHENYKYDPTLRGKDTDAIAQVAKLKPLIEAYHHEDSTLPPALLWRWTYKDERQILLKFATENKKLFKLTIDLIIEERLPNEILFEPDYKNGREALISFYNASPTAFEAAKKLVGLCEIYPKMYFALLNKQK